MVGLYLSITYFYYNNKYDNKKSFAKIKELADIN